MARLCQWLFTVVLFVLVSAGPVNIQKRRGVSLPLKYGVSSAANGSNMRRKRSPSPTIADLKKQLERVRHKYSDAPAPDSGLRKRVTSESLNLTDNGNDFGYFTTVKVGTPRKFYQQFFTQTAHAFKLFHSPKL